MPRRREIQKRKVLPDPVFKEELVSRFINKTYMFGGKKASAEKVFYGAISIIESKGPSALSEHKSAYRVFKLL